MVAETLPFAFVTSQEWATLHSMATPASPTRGGLTRSDGTGVRPLIAISSTPEAHSIAQWFAAFTYLAEKSSGCTREQQGIQVR